MLDELSWSIKSSMCVFSPVSMLYGVRSVKNFLAQSLVCLSDIWKHIVHNTRLVKLKTSLGVLSLRHINLVRTGLCNMFKLNRSCWLITDKDNANNERLTTS
jgi:hypothetical protein